MAKLKLPKITGTINNVTVYWMHNQLFMRAKSNLTAERVINDPSFQPTMAYAALMALASPIGSKVYQALKPKQKKRFSFQYLTGKAINLLKKGFNEMEVLEILQDMFNVVRSFINTGLVQPSVVFAGSALSSDDQFSIESISSHYRIPIIAVAESP